MERRGQRAAPTRACECDGPGALIPSAIPALGPRRGAGTCSCRVGKPRCKSVPCLRRARKRSNGPRLDGVFGPMKPGTRRLIPGASAGTETARRPPPYLFAASRARAAHLLQQYFAAARLGFSIMVPHHSQGRGWCFRKSTCARHQLQQNRCAALWPRYGLPQFSQSRA